VAVPGLVYFLLPQRLVSRQNIEKYKSLFLHVYATIQLSSKGVAKHPSKGNTIQYIYTNSQHKDPLRRVIPLEILQKGESRENTAMNYDKEKYRQMILDGAETVLGYFGFDRTVYENPRNNGRKKKQWYEELHEERTKDIQAEMTTEKQ
jgi:S-formylglutathione hydrolase FrmB